MRKTLDELYFTWLYSKIGSVRLRDQSRTYWHLARQLYKKEFVWIVPNDDNRLEDGRDLRHNFIEDTSIEDVNSDWMNLGCSMLEMFIAFSQRYAFQVDRRARDLFWEMLDTVDIKISDAHYDESAARKIDDTLDRLIWRTYEPNGHGGLFPLDHPTQDQRKVELWYQLNAYIIEKDLV